MISGRQSVWIAVYLWASIYTVVKGLRLPACINGAIELTENLAGQRTTCEDVTQNNNALEWAAESSGGAVQRYARCDSPNQACNADNDIIFTATRDSTSSTLTFVLSAVRGAAGYGGFTAICRYEETTGVSCPVDVINSPSDSEVSCSASPNRWTVTLSCDINRAYSSRNRYTCDFTQGSDSGPSVGQPSTYSAGSGTSDVSGTCTSTGNIPTTSGNYTYYAIVSPGAKVIPVSGVVTVAAPSHDPQISCSNLQSGYLPENSPLACTCSTSDLGQPQGRLLVYRGSNLIVTGSYGDDSVEFGKASVSSSDDSAVYRCVLNWATADSEDRDTTFTLRVAYGPSITNLPNPAVYERHPTNPDTLTLTCTAVGVNPGVTYTWNGNRCRDVTQSMCSFTPEPEDNNAVISCSTTNTITNVQTTSISRTLRIHYPPRSAPTISGYTGQALYAGHTQVMTCIVQGGNPSVSGVTFTCDGQGQEVSGVSSTISATASRDLNGRKCVCGANWENKDSSWYNKTADVTLLVYYPPVSPTITYRSQRYPFLAGESPTVYCTLPTGPDSGNPSASLILEGQTGSAGQSEVRVTLTSLTSADNGRRVVCEARNAFTDHSNNTAIREETALNVYHPPVITVTSLQSDACVMTSPNTCIVRRGQRVHMECSASQSHPSLAWVSWQHTGTRVLDFVADADSSRTYVCEASTVTVDIDDRLPLRALFDLNVIVSDAAVVTSFTMDGVSDQVTVNESTTQHVVLRCTAVGRPAPGLALFKGNNDQLVTKQGGDLTTQGSSVTYELPARCDNTAVYRCEADNGLGTPSQASIVLKVLCPPRLTTTQSPSNLPVVTFQGTAAYLTFDLLTFPVPNIFSVLYLGQESTSSGAQRPVRHDLFKITCVQEGMTSSATCVIRVQGATPDDEGVYRADVRNSEGQTSFLFRLGTGAEERESEGGDVSDTGLLVSLTVVSALLALCVLVNVLFLVWTWRRGWTLPCGKESRTTMDEAADRNPANNPADNLRPVPPSVQETVPTGPYDSLEMSDVGLKSPYDEIGRHGNKAVKTESAYEF